MKEIILRNKEVALVDDEDFDFLNQWKWNRTYDYIYRRYKDELTGKYKVIYMHRIIMNPPDNLVVDHIDHNTLNNQKSNLRNCTRSENSKNTYSKYYGKRKEYKRRGMILNFNKLIKDWNDKNPNDKITQNKIAEEMVIKGIHKSYQAAINLIQYHISGRAKSIDFLMLEFLCTKFNVKPNEIIQ